MNEVSTYREQLPDTLEDLSKFVLVSEERIQALRAEIRAIKKVNLAKEVYEQKLAEAQEIGQITVEAAQKMGELLLQIQKQSGRPKENNFSTYDEKLKTKGEITAEMGMTPNQVSQYQQMAQNPEAVQAAIAKAIENGDVVSRNQVMKEIRAIKAEIAEKDRRIAELQNRKPEVREVEVVPSDYEQLKSEVEQAWAEQRKSANDLNEAKAELRRLQEQSGEKEIQTRLERDADYFSVMVTDFIQRVGGYVWVADRLHDLPEKKRKNFIKSLINLDGWCQAMLRNMEGNING